MRSLSLVVRVLFGVLGAFHVPDSANTGAVFISFFESRLDAHAHPDLNLRHVCPPCRSPAHHSIFSRSLYTLISHFSPCSHPYIFSLFCYHPSHPCFLLRICAPLRRRYQCVFIGTLPFFFSSNKTVRGRSQPTVLCLRKLQRSWRTRRKLRPRANQGLSRS